MHPDAHHRRPGAQRARVVLGGQPVRYEVSGAGPAVVLVHGLGGSARWWRGTAASLARSHRVIVPDLPGFGYGSGAPFSLRDAPPLLDGLLDALGAREAALVGHSFGALACMATAAAQPDRVSRLVLVGPPVTTASPGLVGNVLPVARTVLGLPPSAVLTVLGDAATRSPLALLRAAGEILSHGEPAGGAAAVPTMVVWGERDVLVPLERAAWVERALPEADLRVIAGAGHVPMLDRPAAFSALLERFLGDT
ncbi:MAG: alpha/beta fold hydrolase [Thermoleophilia bacterium]